MAQGYAELAAAVEQGGCHEVLVLERKEAAAHHAGWPCLVRARTPIQGRSEGTPVARPSTSRHSFTMSAAMRIRAYTPTPFTSMWRRGSAH